MPMGKPKRPGRPDLENTTWQERSAARAELTHDQLRACRTDSSLKRRSNGQRLRSIRAYRRRADKLTEMLNNGEIDTRQYKAALQGVQTGGSMLMDELELHAAGIKDQEPGEHPLGEDGGYDASQETVRGFRRKKVRSKLGTDKRGLPTEERSVEVETDADDDGALSEAETDLLR